MFTKITTISHKPSKELNGFIQRRRFCASPHSTELLCCVLMISTQLYQMQMFTSSNLMWTVPIAVASGHINWKFTLYTRQHLCLFVQTREGKEKTKYTYGDDWWHWKYSWQYSRSWALIGCTNNVKAPTSAIYIKYWKQAMEFLHHVMSTSSYCTNFNNSTYLSWVKTMF